MHAVFLLVVVQILLESLPVSSSSHVMLLERVGGILPLPPSILYALHIPTVGMICFFFRQEIMLLLRSMVRDWHIAIKLCLLIGIIDALTIAGFVLLHVIPVTIPLSMGLCVTALLLFSLRIVGHNATRFGIFQAIILGCVQAIALLPGISRFASVYVMARTLGISHRRAFQITWMCAAPLFLAPIILVAYNAAQITCLIHPLVLIGITVATILSYYLLALVEWLARYNYLWMLGFYMIVPIIISITIA